jgi:hypothetical protein
MKKYDLIVAGGGFAGTAAAIEAARSGLSVLLIEQSNCLGGAASNCLVNPFMGWTTKLNDANVELCRGIFAEIRNNLKEFGKATDRALEGIIFNEEYLKFILLEMTEKAGVELLLRSYITETKCSDGTVQSVTVANKSGYMEFYADYFIDATGDADLMYLSGFETKLGREEDSLCQPMTLCFRVANVDTEKFDKERPQIHQLYKKYKEEGKIKNPREDILAFHLLVDDIIHFNSTRIVKLDPTNAFDITKAEIEARKQVFELFSFIKENFESFKNAHILSTAANIGVRESRMICGEHTLNETELKECTRFPDAIAYGNYDIDIHNPEGSGTSHYYFGDGEFYTIPYRSLVPKGSKNILAAGRCISATHEAQASIRIMPIVCCIGQAAGAAVAIAFKEKKAVNDINVDALRDKLYEEDALNKDIF